MRLNILALSYLFPNRAQPEYGIFVFNRLKAIQKFCNIKVISPIQWYPLISRIRRAHRVTRIPLQDKIEGIDVYYPRFPVIPRYLKWLDALTYLWAVHLVVKRLWKKNFEFDLVDVHWTYPDIVAGYFLARIYSKKFIVTVRGREALYLREVTLRRWIVAHFLRRADFVVTLSNELKEIVLALGVIPEKVRVVLNGVNLSRFFRQDRETCRQQLGLDVQKKIILSVGSLIERKGHHEIVRIMPGLSRTEEVELYIVGGVNPEGDFSRALRAMVDDLGLSNVHFVDKVEHELLSTWYGAANLFCLATKGEGCPNVVLEALACGTPVVVTDVGAVGELVVRGENGFLVQADNLISLEEIVRMSLNWDWNRTKIAARMEAWGWSSCAEQVVDIYLSLLGYRQEENI